jgi:hypothetical protein
LRWSAAARRLAARLTPYQRCRYGVRAPHRSHGHRPLFRWSLLAALSCHRAVRAPAVARGAHLVDAPAGGALPRSARGARRPDRSRRRNRHLPRRRRHRSASRVARQLPISPTSGGNARGPLGSTGAFLAALGLRPTRVLSESLLVLFLLLLAHLILRNRWLAYAASPRCSWPWR